ncbi:MAG: RNA methyltransferase [Bacteroidota bacterium]
MPLSKNLIKSLKALHRKKFRQKYNKFMAEGDKIVRELLRQRYYRIEGVYATAEWQRANQDVLENTSTSCTIVNEAELRLISQLTTPNQVLAVVNIPTPPKQVDWDNNWSLYLDGLQDPGNVGTILRIADWFAIPRVVAGPGTVELYNSKVLQASMGAFLRIQWLESDLPNILAEAENLPCWVADMGGDDVFSLSAPSSGILVVGNEGQGLSANVRELATQVISIAAPAGSGAESLNVGVATGILCAALRRKG